VKILCVSGGGREVVTDTAALLAPSVRESVRVDANQWIKQLRLVRYDGQSMRERFTYRGDSLWWFTELYLHKMKRLDRAVALVRALDSAVEHHAPARLIVTGGDAIDASVASAFGAARRLPIETNETAEVRHPRWQSYGVGLTAQLSRLRTTMGAPANRPPVAAFVHSAFWHSSDPQGEAYIGPVLHALANAAPGLCFVGVGPRRNFRARRWWDPVAAAMGTAPPAVTPIERFAPRTRLIGSMALWRDRHALAREICAGDDIRAAAAYRGCDLWPVLRRELEDTARLQWPWSARAMDEAGSALDTLRPNAMLTYAEAGGWGRALVLEARRRSVPSIGLQHGFIYRHWLNYLHEPDEILPLGSDDGCPLPDRTLVYDAYAASHLRGAGHFPESRLAVTGNPRLDDLASRVRARRAERDALRDRLGVAGQPLALLTVKFVEMGAWLPALVSAAASQPGIRVIIKPHPAETADLYGPVIASRSNITMAPAGFDLASLLAASDGILTMNSTVGLDAIVLGIPTLVVGLPSNLSPFVDAGLMLGADAPEGIGQALGALLYDRAVRDRLAAAAGPFIRRYGLEPDGRAAERAVSEILRMTQ